MFVFENLPLEINLMILNYTNYFQEEHRRKFKYVINVINTFPKFIEVFSTKICNRRTIYHHFEKDQRKIYTLKRMEGSYLSFLKFTFPVYINAKT